MKIIWKFNNQPIFSHLGIVTTKLGERSNFMSVPSVTDKNSGVYTCLAFNDVGTSNYSTHLNVYGT